MLYGGTGKRADVTRRSHWNIFQVTSPPDAGYELSNRLQAQEQEQEQENITHRIVVNVFHAI